MQVPIDGIIQDWLYWYPNPWGSHQFASSRYPDPAGMMQQLHDENVHLLISVWPKFDTGSPNAEALRADGDLYPEVMRYVYPPGQGQWYDPFKPSARQLYWHQISEDLFADGVDGWWLDASEPELSGKWGEFRDFPTAAGPGAEVFNAFPLMHTTAVYQGQRAETSSKRVFHPHSLGLRGAAAQQRGHLVGRYRRHLVRFRQTNSRRDQLLDERNPILEHGHRRFFSAPVRMIRNTRAFHPLVRVQRLLPDVPRPRLGHR